MRKQAPTLASIYNAVIEIRYEGDDEIIHTEESPYCDDPECPCQPEVDWDTIPTLPMTERTWQEATQSLNEEQEQAQERNITLRTKYGDWW
jgi:hypothetical protein